MSEQASSLPDTQDDHMSWVRTRMTLDTDLKEWIRHGFGLITVGFGSFSFLEGLASVLGESTGPGLESPSRIFSLVANVIGVLLVASALRHNRKMIEFVNEDAFGGSPPPPLPDEKREGYIALGAIAVGVISFVALLFLQ